MSELLPRRANPCCGYVTDCSSELGEFEPQKPSANDVMICINCGALLIPIDPANNLMRQAKQTDWHPLPDRLKREIVVAQTYIYKRGWLPREARRRKNN